MQAILPDICQHFKLGEAQELIAIAKGHQHMLWRLTTDQGKFAIKECNPRLPLPTENSERYAKMLHQAGIPALSALEAKAFHKEKIDLLVYPWQEGKTLKRDDITPAHTKTMGQLLRQIHDTPIDMTFESAGPPDLPEFSLWQNYISDLKPSSLREALGLALNLIRDISAGYKMGKGLLSAHQIRSHRDLTPENVLWQSENPTIIDWELSGFIHPMQDLIASALDWSLDNEGQINFMRFDAFLKGYGDRKHLPSISMQAVILGVFANWLNWIHMQMEQVINPYLDEAIRMKSAQAARYSLLALRATYRERDALLHRDALG